jgi:pimeloyl-ACP methyl ester carboxylesterase
MTAFDSSGMSPRTSFLSSGASPRTPSRSLTTVLTRNKFRFSPNGMAAACIAGDGQGGRYLEVWSFTGSSVRWWPLPQAEGVTPDTQPIPLDDGRVVLWREGVRGDAPDTRSGVRGDAPDTRSGVRGDAPDDRNEVRDIVPLDRCDIILLDRIDNGKRIRGNAPENTVREWIVGVIHDGLVGLRLLAAPGSDPLAVVIAINSRGHSTIWGVAADPLRLERLAQIPSLLLGGTWLDCTGRFLGVDRAEGDGPAKAVVVDLLDGSWSPLLTVSKTSNDRLLACDPRSGLLIVSTDASGTQRLGWAKLSSDKPVSFPETLYHSDHSILPLTFDPCGQRVLLQVDEGARSRLAIYTPENDDLAPVQIPDGLVYQAACWTDDLLRFPFSAPAQPPGVATVRLEEPSEWSVAGNALMAAGAGWANAHIERLDGAVGPIEAIIYGGQDWKTSRHVLLALHGGPMDAWRFMFDPLFQRLAAAGIAIIAPNQRGSSGYGADHMLAIQGAWGGPDLDDVCALAHVLDAERRVLDAPGLMLLGISYGAFLALLAASCQPNLWSRCVALAPFLSVPRLCQEAPGVRGPIEQLGGLEQVCDDIGPRDVLQLCHALRAKLLIVHGERDQRIPVTQSRALRQRLLELGRREGMDYEYVEVPDAGHELAWAPLHERIVRFLTAETSINPHTATACAVIVP